MSADVVEALLRAPLEEVLRDRSMDILDGDGRWREGHLLAGLILGGVLEERSHGVQGSVEHPGEDGVDAYLWPCI